MPAYYAAQAARIRASQAIATQNPGLLHQGRDAADVARRPQGSEDNHRHRATFLKLVSISIEVDAQDKQDELPPP